MRAEDTPEKDAEVLNGEQANGEGDSAPSALDRVFHACFVIALAALLFLAGSILTIGNIFPGPQITRAVEGGAALYTKLTQYNDVYVSDLWFKERRKDKSVTVNKPAAMKGVTLYTSGDQAAAYLLDMDGKVLHSWKRPYSTVWTRQPGGVQNPLPDSHVYFRKAHVFPNGDLLALYEASGDTPYGYGLVKLDRDSNVIWSYMGHAHHQFDTAPDGRIYVLTHELLDDEIDYFAHLARPRLEDFLVILSPEGKELKKIRLLPRVADSPFRQMLYTISGFALEDPLHANTVKYIDAGAARNFAFGEEGQVLLSFREMHSIAVIDPDTEEVTWATRGPWIGQHDPDILPNGNILLFDNFGNNRRPEGVSRVIEFNPMNMEIVWEYAGTAKDPLDSNIRSDQQRLANGNTLITESNGGRIVEVTPEGEIVWEFVNPVRGGDNKIPIVAWSERLDPARLDPTLLDVPQARLESQTEASL